MNTKWFITKNNIDFDFLYTTSLKNFISTIPAIDLTKSNHIKMHEILKSRNEPEIKINNNPVEHIKWWNYSNNNFIQFYSISKNWSEFLNIPLEHISYYFLTMEGYTISIETKDQIIEIENPTSVFLKTS